MIMNIDLKTLQLNLWKLVQGMMHFRKVSERFVIELSIKRASEDDASHGGRAMSQCSIFPRVGDAIIITTGFPV
jgi:hypothetical protein